MRARLRLLLIPLLVLGMAFAPAQALSLLPDNDNAEAGEVIEDEPGPVTERLATWTQAFAEDFVAQFVAAVTALDPRADVIAWDEVMASLFDVGMVVVPTVLLFMALRWLERPLFRRAGVWGMQGTGAAGVARRTVAIGGSALSDALVILIAWVLGYVLALFVLGERGTMDMRQSLFLNAFLGLELLKAALRVLFAPRYHALRLMPMDDGDAAYWNAWLARLVDFVGYGLLLIVPIVSADMSPALGSVVGFLVLLTGLIYAITIIRQNRARICQRLQAAADSSDLAFSRFTLGLLARSWHVLAIVYFAALAAIIQLRPEDALSLMGQASLQSVIVLGLGIAGYLALSRILGRPIRIPETTRERLPDLEERLNLFVPASVHVLRVLLGVLVVLGLLDAWHLFDALRWITSEGGTRTLATAVSIGIIVIAACTVWVVIASWIDAHLQLDDDGGEDTGARKRTLLALFRNALAIGLAIITLMVVLSEVGINIAPLLAGAGVLGLAIGFGAQKLVQDIITGVFIQLENAINTGDFITVAGMSGTVERLSIRSVGIRDLEGTFHIIPFSHVDTVSNYMRDFGYHLGVYGVAYREDTDEVIRHLRAAFQDLMEDPEVAPYVIGELEVHGVTAFADSAVNVRVRIKTTAGMQWFTGRAYNRLVKRHFDAADIEIPFPHTTLYFGQDKEGAAPPAFVRTLDNAAETQVHDEGDSTEEAPEPAHDPAHDDARELPPEFGDIKREEDPRTASEDAPADPDPNKDSQR
jgi:moderate conductance mechanosensitive channel